MSKPTGSSTFGSEKWFGVNCAGLHFRGIAVPSWEFENPSLASF